MRTQEEIVEEIRKRSQDAPLFDFGPEVLLTRLDFEHADEFLKEGITEGDWLSAPESMTRETLIGEMRDYMAFAWEKAVNGRSLSSIRSLQKMDAWLWLLGDTETLAFLRDEDNYCAYGKPVLRRICERYGFPIPDYANPDMDGYE